MTIARDNTKITVCFAASSGGHFEQLLKLKPLMERYKSFIVTEKTEYVVDSGIETHFMRQVNRREIFFPWKLFLNTIHSFFLLIRKKPKYIICTGTLAVIPICLIGKVFGAKLIYIESFAKINSPTRTGKFLYRYADLFYVQWESMKKFYPKAICLGGIY